MSAARLAAEAAFAAPAAAPETTATLIDIRSWRAGEVASPSPSDPAAADPAARPSRVFRLEAVVASAEPIAGAGVGEADAAQPAAIPTRLRRTRRAAAPVRIVHAADPPVARFAHGRALDAAPTARWANLALALARLDATCAEIRAAQLLQL